MCVSSAEKSSYQTSRNVLTYSKDKQLLRGGPWIDLTTVTLDHTSLTVYLYKIS
jgi:hypothetical protein